MCICNSVNKVCKKICPCKQQQSNDTDENESKFKQVNVPEKGKYISKSAQEIVERKHSDETIENVRRFKRSSSSPRNSPPYTEDKKKRRRGNSIFGVERLSPVNNSGSFDNKVKNRKSIFNSPRKSIFVPKVDSKEGNDPVINQWANKGATVYRAEPIKESKSKPERYWVHTELQYVVVLPADKRKRKSSLPLARPVPSPPPPSPPPPLPPKEEQNKIPHVKELESFSSVGSSSENFVPRSLAKPASKPKGRFCCARRQDSN